MPLNKVEVAQARASISHYLSTNPGEQSTESVAVNVGHSPRTTGQILGGMAKNGLINYVRKQGRHKFWSWIKTKPNGAAGEPEPPAQQMISKPGNPAKEIELSIAGLQIVVGRNPATGRLRIVLEEQ